MRHKLLSLAFFLTALTLSSSAADIPKLERVFQLAKTRSGWAEQQTLSDQMWKLREAIGELDIVSDPVSDRYLITKLGGPIDLVHFLALSAQVCSGKFSLADALYRQWEAEGGPDHEKGLSRVYYPEAHPDDLPSNALGALFGEEVKHLQSDPSADLSQLLHHFLQPLRPAEDQLAKQYSHRYIVMGLPAKASRNQQLSRSEWFTAEPMYMLSALDPALKRKASNARSALRLAGMEVYLIKEKPIGIRRIK